MPSSVIVYVPGVKVAKSALSPAFNVNLPSLSVLYVFSPFLYCLFLAPSPPDNWNWYSVSVSAAGGPVTILETLNATSF